MPQCLWLSGCTGVPRMHEGIQLSSRRDLWDLRQAPCLGPLCPCCSKVHESVEIVLGRDHQGTCGQQFSPWMVQCIRQRQFTVADVGRGSEGGEVLGLAQREQC